MRVAETCSIGSYSKLLVAALICITAAGCFHVQKTSEPAAPNNKDRLTELTETNASLELAVASKDEKILSLEKDVAALNMRILEYEAIIDDLQVRSEGHQKRLEAAIIEVVRTKARLRSLESKAEAASTIAEAEIAVTAMKKKINAADDVMKEEFAAAEQLLKMSAREFKNRNYGGALYLANQSKGQVRALQMHLSGDLERPLMEDEKQFVKPLPLRVLANSNLRSGPGLDNDIVGRLAKDALVTGYAYSGRWVRVETSKGAVGWLFQPLVAPR